MTETEYMKILEPIDKAEESTRPFLVQGEKETAVVGDANDTENKLVDIIIKFRIPTDGGYKTSSVEYKNVFVKPRLAPKIDRVMQDLFPFFRKINDDGTVGRYTPEETNEIISNLPDYIYDELYNLVALVLGVDERLKDYMLVSSVLDAAMLIFQNFPRDN